ncbi:MAG TPA: beta-ketoacyl-[acyl-carrier-protein] synthase family protein [Magnetospirillum sp.]|nr:beta-ketoacyl-[acyl-carrier-protein] synthase family protein [Magnetospirillum sp.]
MRRVVVTGLGAVSAYGRGVEPFWQGILAGRSAVRPITVFDVSPFRSGLGAPVPEELTNASDLRAHFGEPHEDATFYACLAVDEALQDANLPADLSARTPAVGCAVGTLCAGGRNIEAAERAIRTLSEECLERDDALTRANTMLIDYQLDTLCDRFGMTGPSTLISTACSSGTDAIGWGFDAIRSGECDMVVVAGGDIISEVIHAGFNSVFSITQTVPRPFDRDRTGFVIGEGAGALVLEDWDAAKRRGARVRAEILGYGLSNSAYHLTAPSKDGSGESLAMRRAMDEAGLRPEQIDFVNAHGTATAHNDRSEILALAALFGELAPSVSVTSIKSMIGHCMGAAGLIEAVSTVLSLETGWMPPTINFQAPDDVNRFDMVANTARRRSIRHALSNSFGFAGHNSCVAMGRAPEAGGPASNHRGAGR